MLSSVNSRTLQYLSKFCIAHAGAECYAAHSELCPVFVDIDSSAHMGWTGVEEDIVLLSQLSAETVEAAEDVRVETATLSSTSDVPSVMSPVMPQDQSVAWWATAVKDHTRDLPVTNRPLPEVKLVSACSGLLTEAHVFQDRWSENCDTGIRVAAVTEATLALT